MKVRIPQRLVEQRILEAKARGAIEPSKSFRQLHQPDQTGAGIKPRDCGLGTELTGVLKVRESSLRPARMLQFRQSHLDERLRVIGIRPELLFSKCLIERVLFSAFSLRVFGVSKVVDDEFGTRGDPMESGQSTGDGFMHAAFVVNPGITSEEARGGKRHICRIGPRLFEQDGIWFSGLEAQSRAGVAKVVPTRIVVGVDGWG